MKFTLQNYQVDAVGDIVDIFNEGVSRFERQDRYTAISLSAATGAGKTVIATAVIELLLYGDESNEPNAQTTVLWVTDDPSLNQQTKRKMLTASSQLRPTQLVTVDQTLDQETLDGGRVYFVHIQQLGKGATNYVKGGTDKRQWSLWDTIGNTIRDAPQNFLLVIDEAHRGTSARKNGQTTITSKLIDGAGGKLPPAPVVLGISATPERFNEAISKAGQRTLEPVTVDSAEVRESGLIKDKIRIRHPSEQQPADTTLLELAVKDLTEYDAQWGEYADEQQEPAVMPVLVVQVRPKVPDSELRSILDTVTATWGTIDDKAIGHSFEDHTALNLGTRSIRYIAPQDIEDDHLLRVVLFKEALTTGWDCPRAEVMVSLRSAKDHTYIAQLIGRMVRTPLARRIPTNEVLNTVALYLPYYDERQVATVVKGIQGDESQIASEIEVDSVTCGRDARAPKAIWKMLSELPTYTRPAKRYRNDVARPNALATLLAGEGLVSDAIETARRRIIDSLAGEEKRLGREIDRQAANYAELSYQTQTMDFRTGTVETTAGTVAVTPQNIEDLFRRAKRALGDAAGKWYWDQLSNGGMDPDEAKTRVAALASDTTVVEALNVAAKNLLDTWRMEQNTTINKLPDVKRAAFYEIWKQAKDPQEITMIMPSQITAPDREERHRKHIYLNGRKTFPAKLTSWEARVLEAELGTSSLVGWYRNPTGGSRALSVRWEQSRVESVFYPDFLFFHKDDDETVIDIVDPHRPNEADTGPKWLGLARYASEHGWRFRRIVAVLVDDNDELLSLDVKDPASEKRLEGATNETDIRAIFKKYGGRY